MRLLAAAIASRTRVRRRLRAASRRDRLADRRHGGLRRALARGLPADAVHHQETRRAPGPIQ